MIVALALLIVAGLAVAVFLLPNSDRSLSNLVATSILLGSTMVSLLMFAFGYFIAEPYLKWVVAGTILLMLAAATPRLRTRFRINPPELNPVTIILIAILALEVSFVAAACFILPLGSDGLIIWELKARLAFVHGGHVPLSYLSDVNLQWTHNEYPLLVPLTEAWLYLWIGRTHQVLVKVVFLLFYVAAVALLAAPLRDGDTANRRLAGAVLLFFVPILITPEAGSVASGYADFPVAVYYLGFFVFAIRYYDTLNPRFAFLASILAAATAWTKQDGLILWIVAIPVIIFVALRTKHRRHIVTMVVPGLVAILGWKWFLAAVHVPRWNLFNPVTFQNFWAGRDRLAPLFHWLGRELVRTDSWSILWVVFAAFAATSLWRLDERALFATAGVLGPLLFYLLVFVFTNIQPFTLHLGSSMPRLMISPALVALFGITRLWPQPIATSRLNANLRYSYANLARGDLVIRVAAVAALVLFLIFVWPTIYRYDKLTVSGSTYPVRVNRVTGANAILTIEGWRSGSRDDVKVFFSTWSKLLGDARLDHAGNLSVVLYNGTEWPVTKVSLLLIAKHDDGSAMWQRRYQTVKNIQPYSAGQINIFVLSESPAALYEWGVDALEKDYASAVSSEATPAAAVEKLQAIGREKPEEAASIATYLATHFNTVRSGASK